MLCKMSKSLNNAILLSDTPKDVETKVMKMFTDPNRIHPTDPGNSDPSKNPVFLYHHIFNTNKNEVEEMSQSYRKGKIGDVEIKRKLIKVLNDMLEPMRERKEFYERKPDLVNDILKAGIKTNREVAQRTLEEVKDAMGLSYKNLFVGK